MSWMGGQTWGSSQRRLPGFSRASVAMNRIGNALPVWIPRLETETITATPARALDFTGKVAGSLTENPHTFKYRRATTFDAPTTFASEQAQAAYNQVMTQGDSQIAGYPVAVNGEYAQFLFSFDLLTQLKLLGVIPQSWTVTDLKNNLVSLQVTWVGYGVGANAGVATNGATFKRWRHDTADWFTVGTNTAVAPNTITSLYNTADRFEQFLGSTGVAHLLAHSTYPSDGTRPSTIYTDYVKVDVTVRREFTAGTITIEEQAQNLLTLNQSDVETNTVGLNGKLVVNMNITRSTAAAWQGSASLRLEKTINSGTMGAATPSGTRPSVIVGQVYTFSAYFHPVSTARNVRVVLDWRDSGGVSLGTTPGLNVSEIGGTWVRATATGTAPANATHVECQFSVTDIAEVGECHDVDGLQLEQKAYATSWQPGGLTRAAETFQIPTAGILSPTQGAIGFWAYIDAVTKRQVANQWNRLLDINRGDGTWGLDLWHEAAAASWNFVARNDDGTLYGQTVGNDSLTPDGWHQFTIACSGTGATVYLDGAPKATIPTAKLPSAFANSWLGSSTSGSYANTRFAAPWATTDLPTDAQIAAYYASGEPFPTAWNLTYKHDFRRRGRGLVL